MSGDDAGVDDGDGDGTDTADSEEMTVADSDETALEDEPEAVLDALSATIEQRKRDLPADSYTASLIDHESGQNEVLEKVGEEATEVLLAAKDGDDDQLAAESADLVYHLLVLLAMHDLTVDDLRAELASRF